MTLPNFSNRAIWKVVCTLNSPQRGGIFSVGLLELLLEVILSFTVSFGSSVDEFTPPIRSILLISDEPAILYILNDGTDVLQKNIRQRC